MMEDKIQSEAEQLIRKGNIIFYRDLLSGNYLWSENKMDNILEFTLGHSVNSLGLQIADFFATMTYAYKKLGKPSDCGWWQILELSLDNKNGRIYGYGYKEFP